MINVLRAAPALAAVMAVAVAGCGLVGAAGVTESPAPSQAATPAPIATSAPPPSPSAAPTASHTPIEMGVADRQLAAGTYRIADPFRPYTISFPATWTLQTAERGGVSLYRTEPENFAPALIISRVHKVYPDPCHPDPEAPGPATLAYAAAIIAELEGMKGFAVGPVTEVTLGGHPAKAFRLTNDITFEDAQRCEGSPLDVWESGLGRMTTNQGAVDQIWVVDVNGTAITIDAQWLPGLTPADLISEVEAVVKSIRYDK